MKSVSRPLRILLPALLYIAVAAGGAQETSAPAAPAAPTPAVGAPSPTPAGSTGAAATATGESANMVRVDGDSPDNGTGSLASPAHPAGRVRRVRRNSRDQDRVSVMGETHVLADEKVAGSAVGVLSDVIIDGEVADDAVSVLGDMIVNGVVNGNVVSVLSDVRLGPHAHVLGDVVSVGGDVIRAPGAVIEGRLIQKTAGSGVHIGLPATSWWRNGLKLGRPLAVAPGLSWLWVMTACLLGFYALLALMFPVGIVRTGNILATRPLAVVISALLTTLALPVLFILLCVTLIGIPVALLVLPVAVIVAVLFGKAAIYGWIGRRIVDGRAPLVAAVLLGGLLFTLLYLVPVVGLALWLLLGGLGLGCAMTALFSGPKTAPTPAAIYNAPAAAPIYHAPPAAPIYNAPAAAAAAAAPGVAAAGSPANPAGPHGVIPSSAGMASAATATAVAPDISLRVPPPVPGVGDVAGFWIRTAALLIDFILGGMVLAMLQKPHLLPLALAIYGAVMWKLKDSTVGGIICGLRVVRLDGRPLDWPTTTVRALGCFLSIAILGLGFIWVAFDDQKQSWHDKIAGTTVVRAPRGVSLV